MKLIDSQETMGKKKSWSWKKFLVIFLIGWAIILVLFYFGKESSRKEIQDSQIERQSLITECKKGGLSLPQCECMVDWVNQNYSEDIEKAYTKTGKVPQDFFNKAFQDCKDK